MNLNKRFIGIEKNEHTFKIDTQNYEWEKEHNFRTQSSFKRS